MNYNEAYNKIIDAYFKDEINPERSSFCFCGNLNNNSIRWIGGNELYTRKEYIEMENALLFPFGVKRPYGWEGYRNIKKDDKLYEFTLFEGMSKALDVLRQIHIERGETIDGNIGLKKRELLKV